MSRVLVDGLRIRTGPSWKSNVVGHYNKGAIIKSGDLLICDGFSVWLRYHSAGGGLR